jgi:micrococcal nuclease
LVGINTPEIGPNEEPGGVEAKEFVEDLCPPGTEIGLDVDDLELKDHYGRTLAVVYVRVDDIWVNLNAELLRGGYAEVMFIPPSEFNPYEWTS